MGEEQSPLERPYGAVRFVAKSAVVFGAVLAGLQLTKDFSPIIEAGIKLVHSEPWGLPLLFVSFLPVHLVLEVFLIYRRNEIEALRSSPGQVRRVKALRGK
jgi:hypothetical protein